MTTYIQDIFKNSNLKKCFERGEFHTDGRFCVQNNSYLATPYLDTGGDAMREVYNQSHQIRSRECVETQFGDFYRKFNRKWEKFCMRVLTEFHREMYSVHSIV